MDLKTLEQIENASEPESLNTEIDPIPLGVAKATIVSDEIIGQK